MLRLPTILCAFIVLIGITPSAAQPVYQWVNALPGFSSWTLGASNQSSSLIVNRKGETYLFGSFSYAMDVDPGPGVDSMVATVQQGNAANYVCKYTASGQLIWAHNVGTGGWTAAMGEDGHWYAAGGVGVDSMGLGYSADTLSTPGFFIAKYDSLDHLVWAKATGIAASVLSVKPDHNGNIFVTGVFNGTVDFDPQHPGNALFVSSLLDGFIAKYDGDGGFLWARQIKGGDGDQGLTLAVDANNNTLLTGYTAGYLTPSSTFLDTGGVYRMLVCHGGYDGYAAKYTADGAIVWLTALGGAGNDFGRGIATDAAGNVYASGYYEVSMTVDTAANIVLNTGINNISGYLVKLNGASGHPIWGKNYGCDTGSGAISFAQAITCDDTSNIYMTGMFQKSILLNPAAPPIAAGTTHNNAVDYYVLKLDSAGNYKWHIHTYSPWDDEAFQVVLDKANNVYVGGYISDTTDFDLAGPGGLVSYPMPNPNWIQVSFIAKYKQPNPAAVSNVEKNNYSISPNPVQSELTLHASISDNATITVLDLLGRTCNTPVIMLQEKAMIDTRSLVPGMYILQYSEQANTSVFRTKFIKD